jgi:hypothetical protein
MQGKYSPTVFYSYKNNQKWFSMNGGGYDNGINKESSLDNDGYDSYGYSLEDGSGVDRAGHTEDEYSLDEILFERVYEKWNNILIEIKRH